MCCCVCSIRVSPVLVARLVVSSYSKIDKLVGLAFFSISRAGEMFRAYIIAQDGLLDPCLIGGVYKDLSLRPFASASMSETSSVYASPDEQPLEPICT